MFQVFKINLQRMYHILVFHSLSMNQTLLLRGVTEPPRKITCYGIKNIFCSAIVIFKPNELTEH